MKKLYTLIHKAKHSKKHLWLLNFILKRAIPFNKPHSFQIHTIEDQGITTFAPYQKKNFNHLKGIHACAIATVAELAAGLSLMNHLSPKEYRFIMSHIDIDYHYQAKKDIYAKAALSLADRDDILKSLENDGKLLREVITVVYDKDGEKVATVKTIWQIKHWRDVRTKL